jgi:hypothetical protein
MGKKEIVFKQAHVFVSYSPNRGEHYRLGYGRLKDERLEGMLGDYAYDFALPLLKEARLTLFYQNIGDGAKVRKTLTGGLKIRRVNSHSRVHAKTAALSASEYRTLKGLLN